MGVSLRLQWVKFGKRSLNLTSRARFGARYGTKFSTPSPDLAAITTSKLFDGLTRMLRTSFDSRIGIIFVRRPTRRVLLKRRHVSFGRALERGGFKTGHMNRSKRPASAGSSNASNSSSRQRPEASSG